MYFCEEPCPIVVLTKKCQSRPGLNIDLSFRWGIAVCPGRVYSLTRLSLFQRCVQTSVLFRTEVWLVSKIHKKPSSKLIVQISSSANISPEQNNWQVLNKAFYWIFMEIHMNCPYLSVGKYLHPHLCMDSYCFLQL